MRRLLFAAVVLAANAGCQKQASSLSDGGIALKTFPFPGALGVSGVAADDHGVFWAVEERGARVIRFELGGGPARAIPILDPPQEMDLESLAFVGGATLAFGTEGRADDRLTDPIFLGRIAADGVHLFKKYDFDYGAWSIRAEKNRGVEALCAAGGRLAGISEMILESGDTRRSPLMIFDLATGRAVPHLLALSTRTGKISGLACRGLPGGGAIEALAIERHFGTAIVVRFALPLGEKSEVIRAETIFDLGARMNPPPNFEAIEWTAAGEVLLISDNQYGNVTGETQVVRLPLPKHNLGK